MRRVALLTVGVLFLLAGVTVLGTVDVNHATVEYRLAPVDDLPAGTGTTPVHALDGTARTTADRLLAGDRVVTERYEVEWFRRSVVAVTDWRGIHFGRPAALATLADHEPLRSEGDPYRLRRDRDSHGPAFGPFLTVLGVALLGCGALGVVAATGELSEGKAS